MSIGFNSVNSQAVHGNSNSSNDEKAQQVQPPLNSATALFTAQVSTPSSPQKRKYKPEATPTFWLSPQTRRLVDTSSSLSNDFGIEYSKFSLKRQKSVEEGKYLPVKGPFDSDSDDDELSALPSPSSNSNSSRPPSSSDSDAGSTFDGLADLHDDYDHDDDHDMDKNSPISASSSSRSRSNSPESVDSTSSSTSVSQSSSDAKESSDTSDEVARPAKRARIEQ